MSGGTVKSLAEAARHLREALLEADVDLEHVTVTIEVGAGDLGGLRACLMRDAAADITWWRHEELRRDEAEVGSLRFALTEKRRK